MDPGSLVPLAPALIAACVVFHALGVSAQSVAVRAQNGALHLRAPGFSFIKGQPLARLKDGRSIRFDFELAVLARPGTPAVARAQESFVLSYDLWDERFAVTQTASQSAATSHLTAGDAETWVVDRLTIPLAVLGRLGRDQPLWIRLQYIVAGEGDAGAGNEGLTLRGLIDRLSRRAGGELRDAIEAGPLMLAN